MRAVILDLGNVLLLHDNALLFRRLGERAELPEGEVERRLTGTPFWVASNRGELDGPGIRREVLGALGLSMPDDAFDALWSSHFTPHDAVFPLVESLLGRVKVVLLSNTNPLHAAYFLPRLPLLQRFDSLVLSCEVKRVKPEREIYEEALGRAQVSASEAAFFDDVPEYVEAACALGMAGRVFTTADRFREDLSGLGLRA